MFNSSYKFKERKMNRRTRTWRSMVKKLAVELLASVLRRAEVSNGTILYTFLCNVTVDTWINYINCDLYNRWWQATPSQAIITYFVAVLVVYLPFYRCDNVFHQHFWISLGINRLWVWTVHGIASSSLVAIIHVRLCYRAASKIHLCWLSLVWEGISPQMHKESN